MIPFSCFLKRRLSVTKCQSRAVQTYDPEYLRELFFNQGKHQMYPTGGFRRRLRRDISQILRYVSPTFFESISVNRSLNLVNSFSYASYSQRQPNRYFNVYDSLAS